MDKQKSETKAIAVISTPIVKAQNLLFLIYNHSGDISKAKTSCCQNAIQMPLSNLLHVVTNSTKFLNKRRKKN